MKNLKNKYSLTIKDYMQELNNKGIIKNVKFEKFNNTDFQINFDYMGVSYDVLKSKDRTNGIIEILNHDTFSIEYFSNTEIEFIENFYNILESLMDTNIQNGLAENYYCDNYGFCCGNSCRNYYKCNL